MSSRSLLLENAHPLSVSLPSLMDTAIPSFLGRMSPIFSDLWAFFFGIQPPLIKECIPLLCAPPPISLFFLSRIFGMRVEEVFEKESLFE